MGNLHLTTYVADDIFLDLMRGVTAAVRVCVCVVCNLVSKIISIK